MADHLAADGVVRFGYGRGRTVGVGGRFTFNDDASDLLRATLPPLLHVKARDPASRALRPVLDLLTFQTEEARTGGAALCTLVLVNILRTYLMNDERPQSWLGALANRQIGRALCLMHGDVARRWRIADLAGAVGMSRTSFAQSFRTLVGQPPLEYLSRWRMRIACDVLRRKDISLTEVAEMVGYESGTAFSLAFRRLVGNSPGRYRSNFPTKSTRSEARMA